MAQAAVTDAKILGETNFRSGSKAKDEERKKRKKEERLNDGDKLRIAHASRLGQK